MVHIDINRLMIELEALPGWEMRGEAIEKSFICNDFKDAMTLINAIAKIADEQQHHPDIILLNETFLRIITSTKSERGITQKDIDFARLVRKIRD